MYTTYIVLFAASTYASWDLHTGRSSTVINAHKEFYWLLDSPLFILDFQKTRLVTTKVLSKVQILSLQMKMKFYYGAYGYGFLYMCTLHICSQCHCSLPLIWMKDKEYFVIFMNQYSVELIQHCDEVEVPQDNGGSLATQKCSLLFMLIVR